MFRFTANMKNLKNTQLMNKSMTNSNLFPKSKVLEGKQYDKERLARLALPRGNTLNKKAHKSID